MKKAWIALIVMALLLSTPAWCEDDGEWLYADDAQVTDAVPGDGEEIAAAQGETDEWEETLEEAMEVYAWFTRAPLDVDKSITDDSGELYLVVDERYNTYDSLREEVAAYFDDAITDMLMNSGTYVELDGWLYTKAETAQDDRGILETEYTIAEQTAAMVIYDMQVHYADHTDSYTYVLENIDGEWRFTQFPYCV